MLRADQEQLRRAKVACPAEAYPQPPSLGPGWRRAPYSSSHRGPTAPRWRSPTSGGGGSRTSGSGAPPEVQLRHRTSGKRKAGVSQGSDILTLPGSQRGGTLSGGTFPNHVPPSPRLALLPCPFPTTFGSRVGGGGYYLPRSVGTKRKCGRRKLSKTHEGGITGGPILDFKLPRSGKRKSRLAHSLTACRTYVEAGVLLEMPPISQGCSPAASHCPQ